MTEFTPFVELPLPRERLRLAAEMKTQLVNGKTITVVAPPRYQSAPFARAIAEDVRASGFCEYFIDIELEKYAFHPTPLPAVYSEILARLDETASAATEDQMLHALRSSMNRWLRCVIVFHTIDALPRTAQMEMATLIRKFGNDERLGHRVRPIVTGGLELWRLTQSSDLGVSPLNGAELVELQSFTPEDIEEIFPWENCRLNGNEQLDEPARIIKEHTGGHPGLVGLIAEYLKRYRQPISACNAGEFIRTFQDAVNSPDILENQFVVRTLQPLKLSLGMFQFVAALLENKVPTADRGLIRRLHLTGAIENRGDSQRFNGEIFRRAAQLSFKAGDIPAMILAASSEQQPLNIVNDDSAGMPRTVDVALEQVAKTLMQCFGFEYVQVFVANERRRVLQGCLRISRRTDGTLDLDHPDVEVPYHEQEPKSLVGRAASRRTPHLSENVENDPSRDVELWNALGRPTGALLNLPITPDGIELIGVLGVGAKSSTMLSKEADELRKLARDLAPVLKQQQLSVLRQQLVADAMGYGSCYTRRDVTTVLCRSLYNALSPPLVAVFKRLSPEQQSQGGHLLDEPPAVRRLTGNWELQSYIGLPLDKDPDVQRVVLSHLEHVQEAPSQVCHRVDSETGAGNCCSVATLFHKQTALRGPTSAAGTLEYAVVVVDKTEFESPEHQIRQTLDAVATAAQLAVPSLRLVGQREYTMLQYLYQEAWHACVSPLAELSMSCTLLQTVMQNLGTTAEAQKRLDHVTAQLSASLKKMFECHRDLSAVINHSKEDAVTADLRTEVLDSFAGPDITVFYRSQNRPLPLPVRGHPVVWRQCLRNLISNAREASAGKTGIALEVAVFEESVRCTVRDEGPGIPDAALARIYEPGFSTRQSSEDQPRGFGLAFCKMMIEDQHGGTLTVRNRTDGLGVEATMTIPRVAGGTHD